MWKLHVQLKELGGIVQQQPNGKEREGGRWELRCMECAKSKDYDRFEWHQRKQKNDERMNHESEDSKL